MNFAARLGQLDLVKWLHENRHEGCTADAMDWAAQYGHLQVVQWLYSHRSEGCTNKAMIQAACEGHVEIVCFLYDNNINRFLDEEVRNAVHRGRLEMFQLIAAKRGIDLLGGYSVERRICARMEEMLRGAQPRERTYPLQLSDRNHPLRRRCRTLTRWLLENAPECVIHRALELTGFLSNVEVMRWVSESDRARVISDAIREERRDWQELVHWTFKHTTFTDPACRRAIRGAIQDAPEEMTQ